MKGFIELNAWTGHYLYDEGFKLIKDKVVVNGRIGLWIGEASTSEDGFNISQEQLNAYLFLVRQQHGIRQAILESLKKEFPNFLANDHASRDQDEDNFPGISDLSPTSDLKDHIGPETISINDDTKDGAAYVTWNFRCRWDIEHGFEVITHNDRVIDIAPNVDTWKIYKDNGTYDEEQRKYSEQEWTLPKKKKWWHFW